MEALAAGAVAGSRLVTVVAAIVAMTVLVVVAGLVVIVVVVVVAVITVRVSTFVPVVVAVVTLAVVASAVAAPTVVAAAVGVAIARSAFGQRLVRGHRSWRNHGERESRLRPVDDEQEPARGPAERAADPQRVLRETAVRLRAERRSPASRA